MAALTIDEIRAHLASFAVTVDPTNRNKEYKLPVYFATEGEMDQALAALGLVRIGDGVYDPVYPFKKGKAEKRIGWWYAPGRWVPPGEWDVMRGHPGEAEWDAYRKSHGHFVHGDSMDGIVGEEVA